ncbi:MAG: hypothetical protein D8M59_08985 [Planctomycetes bacterium]|nr:hypothetical protein [Planctomycetota bacterium]
MVVVWVGIVVDPDAIAPSVATICATREEDVADVIIRYAGGQQIDPAVALAAGIVGFDVGLATCSCRIDGKVERWYSQIHDCRVGELRILRRITCVVRALNMYAIFPRTHVYSPIRPY